MTPKTKLYLSERIVLLRLIDLMFLFLGILLCNMYIEFSYIRFLENPVSKHTVTLAIYYLVCAQVFEMYNLREASSRFKTTKNLIVTSVTCVLAYLYTPLITPVMPANRLEIVVFLACVFLPILCWRNFYIYTLSGHKFYKNLLIICGDQKSLLELFFYVKNETRDHAIAGYVSDQSISNLDGFLDVKTTNLEKIVATHQVKELVIALKGFSDKNLEILNRQLVHLFEKGIRISSYEDYVEKITNCVPEKNLTKHFYQYFNFSDNHENRLYDLTVRLVDVFVSILGLSFMLLCIPFVFACNLIWNKGKLFYKQQRVGVKGKVFSIVKFRSMVSTAEKNGIQWAVKNDARVTKFGKVLRKTRIDEIPQFWNVLKGDMHLIGPRPERPEFVKRLETQIPLYAIRHAIKPGLTGWAQVMYPYASTLEQQQKKLRYDLYYIKKRGLFLDLKIFIKTMNTVLYFKGQ